MRIQTPRSAPRRLRRALRMTVAATAAVATLLVGAASASAGQPTAVTFSPDTNLSDTPSAIWTIGFTTSASGALISGNAVMVTFPSGFDVSGASAALVSGFGPTCTAPSTIVSAQNIFVRLNGASCGIGNSSAGVLTITGISSPATQYGTGALGGFKVASYGDATLGSPIDGVGGYPPSGGMFITASLTYSTQASDGSPIGTGSAPVDAGSPFTNVAAPTTIEGNTGNLVLPGYAFAGWCTTNVAADPTQCTGTQYASGDPLTVSANTTLYSVWTLTAAADGTGTLTTPTTSVLGSSTNTIVFTYTAAPGGMSHGAVHVQVPTGWSAPSAAAGAGCTTASTGTLTFAGQAIQLTDLSLAGGGTATITYGATSGGSCTAGSEAIAPATAGSGTFTATQKSLTGGTLVALASSPSVSVTVPSCTAGSYLVGVSCIPAGLGFFVPLGGATSQTPCPVGTFSAVSGATSCTPAPPGKYVDVTGAAAAQSCSPGAYSSTAGSTSCKAASPGSYVADAGASGQSECGAGYFSAVNGATQCTAAPAGSYVPRNGATKPEACEVNEITSAPARTSCTRCPDGQGTRGMRGAVRCRFPALRADTLTFAWVNSSSSSERGRTGVSLALNGNWSEPGVGLSRFEVTQLSAPLPTNGVCAGAYWRDAIRDEVDIAQGLSRSMPFSIPTPNSTPRCIRFELKMVGQYADDEPVIVVSNAQSTAVLPAVVRVVVKLTNLFSDHERSFIGEDLRLILINAVNVRASQISLNPDPSSSVLMRASTKPPANMFRLRSTRRPNGVFNMRLVLTKAGRAYLNSHPKLKGTRQRMSGTFFVRLKGSRTPERMQQTFWLRMPR